MIAKRIYLTLAAVAVCAVGCKDKDENIPIRKPKPPAPPEELVYNDLGFEPHKDGEPFDTYRGLVMAGYQGWFGGPSDTEGFGGEQWYHYRESNVFKPGVLQNSIDFWPDMSEYTQTYTPGVDGNPSSSGKFILPGGEAATVYSAFDESSVLLHFKWMQEYGLDGVFMQRFVGETVNQTTHKAHFDKVLEHAMKGSNQYQRAICVMYDLGGYEPSGNRNTAAVLADAQSIMDKYALKDRTRQKFYLHHNGKPMIVLWGVGFNDNRPYSLDDIEQLMTGLREMGFSIMLGVPTFWRERRGDTVGEAKLTELIKAADVIMPWFVGRFGDHNYESGGFADLVKADVEWCEANDVDYAPLCYPGSSDRNMHPHNPVNPRNGGNFLWKQMHNCIESGAKMLYIAMFDEIDEGTAIYKCLNTKDLPSNVAETDYWVSSYENGSYRKTNDQQTGAFNGSALRWSTRVNELGITFTGIEDGLPTDHYLWLVGQGRKMLRGEVPLKTTWPER